MNREFLKDGITFVSNCGICHQNSGIPFLTENQRHFYYSFIMCLIDEAMEIFFKNNPDSRRSFKVSQAVATNINCYKEIYFTLKKKAVQQTLDQFFVKKADLRQQPQWTHQTVINFYFVFKN